MDFIHLSQSLGRALVLFTHKKDGLLWLCINFCSLNKIMKDCYPLPHITDLLDSLCKAKIYSKIDSGTPTIWSESKRAMNGRRLSGLTTAPLNGV